MPAQESAICPFYWPSKPRQKLTGLLNQGGTCYLNTLIQTLLHTPEFTYRLFNLTKTVRKENLKRMIQELLNLFQALISNGGGAISSKPLTDSFGWTEDEVCVHQDIQELNRLLFEQIEIALKGTKETNLINDLFRGVQCTRIRCLKCGRVSERNDEFQDVNLSVMEHDSIEASLAAHTQMERLTGDNQYFCEACRCKVDAVKMTRFEELPPILTLSLSRFYFDSKTMQSVKLEKMCSFPFVLDMSNFSTERTSKRPKYDLFSIVLHVGGSTGGGHYHAYIKDPYGTILERNHDIESNNKNRSSNRSTRGSETSIKPIHPKNDYDVDTPLAHGEQPEPKAHKHFNITSPIGSEGKTGWGDHNPPQLEQPSSSSKHKSSSETDQDTIYMPKTSEIAGWKKRNRGLGGLPVSPLVASSGCSDTSLDYWRQSDLASKDNSLRSLDKVDPPSSPYASENQSVLRQASMVSTLADRLKKTLTIETENKDKWTNSLPRNNTLNKSSERSVSRKPKCCHTSRMRNTTGSSCSHHNRTKLVADNKFASGAICVYPVKMPSCKKATKHRSQSVAATGTVASNAFGVEIRRSTRKQCTNRVHLSSESKVSCASRGSQRDKSFRHARTKISKSSRGTSNQIGQHNSLPQRRTISSSSSSPPTDEQKLCCYDSSFTVKTSSQCSSTSGWRSKLFDKGAANENHKLRDVQHHSLRPANHNFNSPGFQALSSPQSNEFNGNLNDPPPAYDSLDTVPPIHRSNAYAPVSWTYSREIEASQQPDSEVKTQSFSSFTEQNAQPQKFGQPRNTDEDQTAESSTIKQTSAKLPDGSINSLTSEDTSPDIVVGRWFDINDDSIVEVDPTTFNRVFEGPECAYMLFYRLMSLPNPTSLIIK